MTTFYLEPIQYDKKIFKLTKEEENVFIKKMTGEMKKFNELYSKQFNTQQVMCDNVIIGNDSLHYSILYHLLFNNKITYQDILFKKNKINIQSTMEKIIEMSTIKTNIVDNKTGIIHQESNKGENYLNRIENKFNINFIFYNLLHVDDLPYISQITISELPGFSKYNIIQNDTFIKCKIILIGSDYINIISKNKIILTDKYYYCSFNETSKYNHEKNTIKTIVNYIFGMHFDSIAVTCKLNIQLEPSVFLPEFIDINTIYLSIYNGLKSYWKYFNQILTNIESTRDGLSIVPSISDLFALNDNLTLFIKNMCTGDNIDTWITSDMIKTIINTLNINAIIVKIDSIIDDKDIEFDTSANKITNNSNINEHLVILHITGRTINNLSTLSFRPFLEHDFFCVILNNIPTTDNVVPDKKVLNAIFNKKMDYLKSEKQKKDEIKMKEDADKAQKVLESLLKKEENEIKMKEMKKIKERDKKEKEKKERERRELDRIEKEQIKKEEIDRKDMERKEIERKEMELMRERDIKREIEKGEIDRLEQLRIKERKEIERKEMELMRERDIQIEIERNRLEQLRIKEMEEIEIKVRLEKERYKIEKTKIIEQMDQTIDIEITREIQKNIESYDTIIYNSFIEELDNILSLILPLLSYETKLLIYIRGGQAYRLHNNKMINSLPPTIDYDIVIYIPSDNINNYVSYIMNTLFNQYNSIIIELFDKIAIMTSPNIMDIDGILASHIYTLNNFKQTGPYSYVKYNNLIIIIYTYNKKNISTVSYFYSTLVNDKIETIYEFMFTNNSNEMIYEENLNNIFEDKDDMINILKRYLLNYNTLIQKSLLSLLNRGMDGYIYRMKLDTLRYKANKDKIRLYLLFNFLHFNSLEFNELYYNIFLLICKILLQCKEEYPHLVLCNSSIKDKILLLIENPTTGYLDVLDEFITSLQMNPDTLAKYKYKYLITKLKYLNLCQKFNKL